MIICGGDEAGRGALIGPLVVAIVSVRKSNEHKLAEIGVRDSKLLSRRRRENLYDAIKGIAQDVKVSKIYPKEINEAMRSGVSLNELEATHFAKLFDRLSGQVGSLYLDSPDVIAEKFGMRVNMLSKKPTRVKGISQKGVGTGSYTKVIAEHKADSKYPVVSAASIIAKVERDWEIDRIADEVGIDLGSGYPADAYTIGAIKENLKSEVLKRHIRQYWQTMDEIKQTRLVNF
ncbi:MAG: ribonuclease HII [Candidatus Marsarchaeota archaeon]|jgi:ribonuclease HII|nr:ribonuclease HII [Candidatus Marsarchaeota archaeon]MCL5111418.1 ribonuclease HII [Candidatus Marsarchaeota archaeon]